MAAVIRGAEPSLCRRHLFCPAGTVLLEAMLATHARASCILRSKSPAQ